MHFKIALVKPQCAEPKAEGPEVKVKRSIIFIVKIILYFYIVRHVIYFFSLHFQICSCIVAPPPDV